MWWQIQVTFWFWRKSSMNIRESWRYAKCMDHEYWTDSDAETTVECEMSYWSADVG